VYVYDIDDLNSTIEQNIDERRHEALRGNRIVDKAVIQFRRWFESLDVVPTIVAIRNKMEDIRQKELKKTLATLSSASEEDRMAIDRLTAAIVNKILHNPTVFLKERGHKDKKTLYVDVARRLFHLDESNDMGRGDS